MTSVAFLCLAVAVAAAVQPLERCNGNASDPKVAALCTWLIEECSMTDDILIGNYKRKEGFTIRGLGTPKAVRAGQAVHCIPMRCIKTLPPYKKRSVFTRCKYDYQNAIFLAKARKKRMPQWNVYLDSMPDLAELEKSHPAGLIFRSDITDNIVVRYWRKELDLLRRCYEKNLKVDGEQLELKELFWSLVFLTTRRTDNFPSKNELSFFPLYDMINSGPDDQVNVHEGRHTGGNFCFMATRDLDAGAELIAEYVGTETVSALDNYATMGFALSSSHHYPISEEDCDGLWPDEFPEPSRDDLVLHNLWSVAREHCRDENEEL